MQKRLLFLSFFFLYIGLIFLAKTEKSLHLPSNIKSILPKINLQDEVVKNEYLLLIDENIDRKSFIKNHGLNDGLNIYPWILAKLDKKEYDYFLKHPEIIDIKEDQIQEVEDSAFCAKKLSDGNSLYNFQWYLHKENGVNFEEAWSIFDGTKNQMVAIVDRNFIKKDCQNRQVFYDNILEYLPNKNNIQRLENFKHGEQVFNVLAPCEESGLLGADLKTSVFLVDSLDDKSLSTRLFALLYAAGFEVKPQVKSLHRALVINTSFGFTGPFLKDPPYGPVLDVIGQINKNGQVVVASAGNEGIMGDFRLPGSLGGVISVGSSTKEKKASKFSNYGKTIDVLAPGEEILGIDEKGEPIFLNGTSFSAPLVSGIVSLILGFNPNLSWKHAEYILKKTATPISCENYCHNESCKSYCCIEDKVICAKGIVNAKNALIMAQSKEFLNPLIDLDDYFIVLNKNNKYSASFILKNWGQEDAIVYINSDKNLSFSQNPIYLPKSPELGLTSKVEVLVKLNKKIRSKANYPVIFEAKKGEEILDDIEGLVKVSYKN